MSDAVPERDPTTTDAGVALDNITVEFSGVTALEDVSLSVDEGEFFTLVGPSGCGKTTTLRAVAGFEEPATGEVHIDGGRVTDLAPERRDVGVVFQHYALFPHMTVRENVAYGLRFRDPPGGVADDERVDELLSLVDMAGMGEREPEQLSGGQQQRIALARALAPGPDVLLLDEPLSALDARLRERLRVTIREIQQELGITTIYVTHDQSEALAISDRVAVVSGGRIEQVAPPETVYREPQSRFVAEFVGENNLFDGEVTATAPPRATVDGVEIALPESAAVDTGDSVALCVRPEVLSLGENDTASNATTLTATVEHREFLGDAYRVHCSWNGRSLLVKTDSREPPEGTVTLTVDTDDIHLLSDSGR
ncbi:ABC transporter [Halococcus morrhuae DSM 1307]|uniref:Molybdate/tungstate import ATP-binding protein WtpC n=1 Tax=Halococcus morrhuae DSM 1307 TaxID=931277 RepID=M0MPA3_HALMO|nr:ABC transporter ATP-binding protein [Halococcus morrhuae]EMA47522.1 ABC transporter [Halococcus morrhuae DSM 1307]